MLNNTPGVKWKIATFLRGKIKNYLSQKLSLQAKVSK